MNRCENCKHWDITEANESRDMQKCNTLSNNPEVIINSQNIIEMRNDDSFHDSDIYGIPDYYTGKNFGCIHFKKIE